jgi:hypothetical protein
MCWRASLSSSVRRPTADLPPPNLKTLLLATLRLTWAEERVIAASIRPDLEAVTGGEALGVPFGRGVTVCSVFEAPLRKLTAAAKACRDESI